MTEAVNIAAPALASITFKLEDIIMFVITVLGLVGTWLAIWFARKADKKAQSDERAKHTKDKSEKDIAEAVREGKREAEKTQMDKEVVAIWNELTQHGTKIQTIEVTSATLNGKMDSMMQLLQEIRSDVRLHITDSK